MFDLFVKALETGTKVPVTKDNAGAISLLAKGSWLEDLLSESSALQVASNPELITVLSDRVTKLEHQLYSQPLLILTELKDSTATIESRLSHFCA
jgi:hypothetical protein